VATLALLTSFAFLAAVGAAPAVAQSADPSFSVRMVQQEIHGYGWEQGIEVTAEIDDPDTGVDPDWTDTQLALPPEWDPASSFVQFQPFIDDYTIEPGDVVTLTQSVGGTTYVREHIVTTLTVTDVDEVTDVVTGTGEVGTIVDVDVWDDSSQVGRNVTVQPDGTWSADFASGGDVFDIAPGTGGEASQPDADGDRTSWWIRVPDPAFSVETPRSMWSMNDGWVPGRTVTITVDDNDDLGDGYLFQTAIDVVSWGPSVWESGWGFDQFPFTIMPGHYVTVDDGVEVTKTLHVVDLVITNVDAAADVITGTAPPAAVVDVHACSQFDCEDLVVTADGDGFWTANFTIDIQTEFGGAAQIYDPDGDATHRGWQLNAPYFGVDVANEEMWAVNWPAGATLTFQVFADATMSNLLWTDTMTVFGTPWQNTEAGYRFWGEFDVQGGQYFTVSDGVTSKDLAISSLSITDVNPFDDYYTGTVDPTIPADVETEVCAWARSLTGDNEGVHLCSLPDPGTGEWTIDFSGVGDIIPGDHLGVSQRDADEDETSHSWGVPPWIYVELAEQDAAGNDLYPDRVHLDQWVGPVDIYLDGSQVMTGVVTNGEYLQVDLDVEIGQTIRVVDGQNDKELDIELLTVDTVTPWDDPVQPSTAFGTAGIPATDQRNIQVTASADYGWWTERWVPVVSGHYQADFANPGNGWRESEIGYFGEGGADDIYLGGEVRAHLWDFDNDQVQAIWHTCNPRIIIVRNNDRIEAICFPEGSELVVELDDPAFAGIEWTSGDPVIVTRNPEMPWETLVVFELGDYQAPPAAVVTATATDDQGTPLVEVTTEVIGFTVDEPIDVDNDRVTGTAPVGAEVLVQADGEWRHPIADESGYWVADFSVPGEGQAQQQTVDIGPGSSGGATLIDENGSATTIAWSVSNATFQVSHEWDQVWVNEFEPDTALAITVDDHSGSGPVTVPGGPYLTGGEGYLDIDFDPAELDLQPGDTVSVSDGITTKSHTITDLAVTELSETTDTVSGYAAPLTDVDVWVHDTEAWRHVVADASGHWLADFGVPGDEPGESYLADLVPGTNGNSGQCDVDGDCTTAGWNIFNPQINVDPHGDWLWGSEWTPGDSVAITIAGVPYTTWVADEHGTIGDWETPVTVDIIAGMTIEAAGTDATKTHTVAPLTITDADAVTDTISGTANPAAWVDVWFHDGRDGTQVRADASGFWTADFAGVQDLQPGDSGPSAECDGDGDCTYADWWIPNPHFNVDPNGDWVWGHGWQPSSGVTVTIGDLEATLSTDEWGDFGDEWDQEAIDLVAGMEIVVTDGIATKTHTVTGLAVTGADAAADVVTGVAGALSWVQAGIHETDAWVEVQADAGGSWTADFSALHDIVPGSSGYSNECDDDGDCTFADWHIANPTFSIETPSWIWSSNEDWELGDTITLTIDDPDFPGPMTTTVAPDEQNPENIGWWFDLDGLFEIEPGHVVTVTDGEYTKSLTVSDLVIELVDPTAGTVTGWLFDQDGNPVPDVPVDVHVDNEHGNGHRRVVTAASGYWVADFSVPGEGEGPESDPFEIVPGTGISAQAYDGDWDSTHRGVCFDCDDGQFIDPIDLEAGDVLISETDGTLWVYDPDDASLEEHPLPFGGVWDIQFVWGETLFIANSGDGRIWVLDLPSGELAPLDDPLFGQPFGMTIESDTAAGWSPVAMWVADGVSGILRFDDGGAVQIVDMPGVDGIVVASEGPVYFTDLSGKLFVVDETQPDNYRVVADVGGYSLNGLTVLPDGTILATSMGPAALVTIDPETGNYEVHEYPELWSPEDSALGRTGETYVIDSGFEAQFGDQSGLYVRNADGTLTQLVSHHDYPEFGDTVDLLVVGPTVTVTKTASQTEVFAPDGDLIEYTLDVHNLLGPFGHVTLDGLMDSKFGDLFGLGTCATISPLGSGESYTCPYEVWIAGDAGEIVNTVTVSWTDERGQSSESSDSATVTVVEAAVSIDKTIASASAGPGDGILVAPGEMLTWSFVVTNEGDTDVVDLVVEDDVFGDVCIISSLVPGASATCTLEATAEIGEHADVATVTGTAVDADGDTMAVEAQDGSSYLGLDPVYVTDSQVCVIDGFDLVFTPDMKNWPGRFKLSASNPGQFYWNGFVRTDEPATIGIEVPYPFVTQGAMPLHDHGGVAVGDGSCFTPLDEGISHGAVVGLDDYTDTNGDGMVGFGDAVTVEVEVAAGFHYVNLHLEHGLEGSNGWSSDGSNAFNDPDIDPELRGIDVLDAVDHAFTIWVDDIRYDDSVVAIANHNEFKNVKGFGGLVLLAADGTPVAGIELELRDDSGVLVETMTTDTNGWYLSEYRHNGKQAKYDIALLDPDGGDLAVVRVTVGKGVKFGEANFAP
jgi:hypothetical protein